MGQRRIRSLLEIMLGCGEDVKPHRDGHSFSFSKDWALEYQKRLWDVCGVCVRGYSLQHAVCYSDTGSKQMSIGGYLNAGPAKLWNAAPESGMMKSLQ